MDFVGDTNNVPGVKIKLLTHASLPEGNYFSPEMSLRCIVDLINEDIGNLHTSMLELTMISKVFKRAEGYLFIHIFIISFLIIFFADASELIVFDDKFVSFSYFTNSCIRCSLLDSMSFSCIVVV